MKACKLILVTLVMIAMMSASVVMAQPSGNSRSGPGDMSVSEDGTGNGPRPMRPQPRGPLGRMVKFFHQNLTIAVLAELTGMDADIVEAELELSHPGEILAPYDIDMETFIAAMDTEMTALIGSAVSAGMLTQDQADEIITMIEEKPERPERADSPSEK